MILRISKATLTFRKCYRFGSQIIEDIFVWRSIRSSLRFLVWHCFCNIGNKIYALARGFRQLSHLLHGQFSNSAFSKQGCRPKDASQSTADDTSCFRRWWFVCCRILSPCVFLARHSDINIITYFIQLIIDSFLVHFRLEVSPPWLYAINDSQPDGFSWCELNKYLLFFHSCLVSIWCSWGTSSPCHFFRHYTFTVCRKRPIVSSTRQTPMRPRRACLRTTLNTG